MNITFLGVTKLNPQHGPDTRILRQGVFSGGVQEAPAGVGGVRRGRGGGPLRSVNTQGTCSNPREPPGTYRMLLGGAQPRRRKPGPLSFTHSKYSVKNWFFVLHLMPGKKNQKPQLCRTGRSTQNGHWVIHKGSTSVLSGLVNIWFWFCGFAFFVLNSAQVEKVALCQAQS